MNDLQDLRNLKKMAIKLKEPLKTLILSEPDFVPRDRYFEISNQWLKILKIEKEVIKNE